jgi:hypothetical protein
MALCISDGLTLKAKPFTTGAMKLSPETRGISRVHCIHVSPIIVTVRLFHTGHILIVLNQETLISSTYQKSL